MTLISSVFLDPNKRFGAALGALSGGRVGIIGMAASNLKAAVSISLRYSAVRRQFGPPGKKEEIPVIEYQLQVSNQSFMKLPPSSSPGNVWLGQPWPYETHSHNHNQQFLALVLVEEEKQALAVKDERYPKCGYESNQD